MGEEYVSIVVCHYSKIDDHGETSSGKNPPKRSDLLRKLINSIEENTDYPMELIVMDNGGNPDDSDFLLQKVREGTINTYVRYKNNMHFAYAFNQGAKLATGKYIGFICNDIELYKGWLTSCVALLKKYKGQKIIATPFITYDKRRYTTLDDEKNRINPRSGSNCMIMTPETFYNIGEFAIHRVAGTIWFNKLKNMGYKTIAPPEDLAKDLGWRAGVNFSIPIKVIKKLLNGEEIHFEEKNQ